MSRPRAARILLWFTMIACFSAPSSADPQLDQAFKNMRNLNAVQQVYRAAVPHVDARGQTLTKYDPRRSFFPIGIWSATHGEAFEYSYDWRQLRDAGFNTVWVWPATPPDKGLELARQFDLQAIVGWDLTVEQLNAVKDHPNLLANLWTDEPTGGVGSVDMEAKFASFQEYLKLTKQHAPQLPVFVNDCPWFMPPATQWWTKWNTAGSISCNDNYPIKTLTQQARSIGLEPNGIPQTVSLQVAVNHESKPVWLIVGAFEEPRPGSPFPFRFPTPQQLRAQVYAAIIHGATGIHYFALDSYITREAMVIGMSPNPQATISPAPGTPGALRRNTPATPMQLIQGKACWDAAAQINSEIAELTPIILSPTVGREFDYRVEIEGAAVTDSPLRCLLKPHPDGGYVLLSVNLDDAVLSATWRFPTALAKVQALFENQPALAIEQDKQSFTVRYEPFETHVLRVVPAVP